VLGAFLRRDFRINLSYRLAFGLQALSVLFPLVLYFFLGRVVDQSNFAARQGLGGGYFGYAAVGLALLTIVQISLASFANKLREEQFTGTLEALLATPASSSLIVLASAGYELLRGVIRALITIVVAVVVFGLALDLDPGSLGVVGLALVGALGLFAALGVAVAAFTVIFKQTAALTGIIGYGLGILGGVYFPIEVMPTPLEEIAAALPFTWGLDVLRASLLGGDVDPLQLVGLFGSAMLLLPAALLGFRMAVQHARRRGTLAQY
jgi:ABC-2 type transport system permease protein